MWNGGSFSTALLLTLIYFESRAMWFLPKITSRQTVEVATYLFSRSMWTQIVYTDVLEWSSCIFYVFVLDSVVCDVRFCWINILYYVLRRINIIYCRRTSYVFFSQLGSIPWCHNCHISQNKKWLARQLNISWNKMV